MDSDSHHHHYLHHPQPQPPHQQQHVMVGVGPTNTVTTAPSMSMMMSQHHHHQQHPHHLQAPSHATANSSSNVPERFQFHSVGNSGVPPPSMDFSDGSPRAGPGFNVDPARKKRGRPRKYSPDGNISLGLSPTPGNASGGHVDYSSGGGGSAGAITPSSEPSVKRRGRPPGSGKRQLDALGTTGVKFTPHVILVKTGKDIASQIMAFAEQGPRALCILSANGSICNVALRQPSTPTGTVAYEGRFEIISLSGSFLPPENNGGHHRTSGLSVSLAGSDGRVLGGVVVGMLTAASSVQVIVGSFVTDGKKPKNKLPLLLEPNTLNFGAPLTGASPPSQDPSSDESDESGDSALNHQAPGPYGNSSQPIQGMYTNMGWPNPSGKMHPN